MMEPPSNGEPSDYVRVERVRDGHDGFAEHLHSEAIGPPIRLANEYDTIEETVATVDPWDSVRLSIGQSLGRSDQRVVHEKTVTALVDELNVGGSSDQAPFREEWEIELSFLRGTGTESDWEFRSVTGAGDDGVPWPVYSYPYNPKTGVCQPDSTILSGWLIELERL